eukprot:160429-Pyramimonas_sp.AAC.1
MAAGRRTILSDRGWCCTRACAPARRGSWAGSAHYYLGPVRVHQSVLASVSILLEGPPELHAPVPECGVLRRGPRGL